MKNLVVFAAAVVLATSCIGAIVGCNSKTAAQTDGQKPEKLVTDETQSPEPQKTGGGMAAMQEAAKAKKYLFALFRKEDESQTSAMRAVLEEVMEEVADTPQERVSGQGRLGRRGHLLAAHRLRGHRDGNRSRTGGQEDSGA